MPVAIGGDNLPSPVEIGLTDLPNIGGPVAALGVFIYKNFLYSSKLGKSKSYLVQIKVCIVIERMILQNESTYIRKKLIVTYMG